MRTVYLNGQFVPEAEAKLSIYDLSIMQAAAAFEMTRSFNGDHFKLREHLMRLMDSCQSLQIPCEQTIAEIETICELVSNMNDHGDGEEHRLLIVASPGCAPMYKDLAGVIPHPFLYIADFPLRYTVKGFSKYFTDGVHCVTSKVHQVPDACIPSSAKHRSRLHFHLAQMQAPAGTWPLMTDGNDDYECYTEAPGANILFKWKWNSRIMSIEENCLPGISMETVKELINSEQCSLGVYSPDHSQIEEMWLTGTPFCMVPVVSLDGKPIGDGTPGPVFKQTLAKWSAMVGVDIQGQIAQWDSQHE